MKYSFFLFSLFVSTHLLCHATEQIILQNGDTLHGKTLKIEDGTLYFESDILGLLQIDVANVIVQKQNSNQSASPKKMTAKIPLTQGKRISLKKTAGEIHDWTREVEFGFTNQSGRIEKTDMSVRFQMEKQTKKDDYRFQSSYIYGESNNEESSNTGDASFRWRHSLSPTLFGQSLSSYNTDQIKGIDHDIKQGFGIGRNFILSEKFQFTLGSGATARYREEESMPAEWNYLIDAFQDLSLDITSRFKITQDMLVFLSPENPDEYSVELNAALVGKITETIKVTMRYEYEYDRSLLPENRANQRVLTSLGYIF